MTAFIKYKHNNGIEFSFKEIGLTFPKWNKEKKVLTWLINIKNTNNNKEIEFFFYDSINNTELFYDNKHKGEYYFKKYRKQVLNDLLYSVLCDVEFNFFAEYTNKYDFFDDFGYKPTIENENLFNFCLIHQNNLKKVFSSDLVKTFNEEFLSETIKNDFILLESVKQ